MKEKRTMTDWAGFIMTILGLVISLVALILAFQANNFTKENSNIVLETETKVEVGELNESSRTNVNENKNYINIPIKVSPKIEQGKIKAAYSLNEESTDGYQVSKLEINKENEINLKMLIEGKAEDLQKTPLYFFVSYIDYSDNVYLDYIQILPKYISHSPKVEIKKSNGEIENQQSEGLLLVSAAPKAYSQYELFSNDGYQKAIKNKEFNYISHKEYLEKYLHAKKFIDEYL